MTRSDPVSLYDNDFFAWTQSQAAALRQMKPGVADIDIDYLAEEIEDLGKRDLREVQSFLRRFIEHIIKLRRVRRLTLCFIGARRREPFINQHSRPILQA